jgi:dihydropteroate synthase
MERRAAPLVMGVLNVTPDSFSDGGRWLDHGAAVEHGLAMVAEGAAVVDVGGESTRPGAEPVAPAEEMRRVLPAVEALAAHVRVSIDTRHAEVAEAALAAGATLLNDVSASLAGVAAAAGSGVGFVAMHMQGEPRTMQVDPRYHDVVAEVTAFLVERAEAAVAAGVEDVWVDPGIGFGKTLEHNLALLAHLDRLVSAGFPVVVGTSRKGLLGRLLADADGGGPDSPPVPVDDRLDGSLATAAWAMWQGARMIRAHDVGPTARAAALVAAMEDESCPR